MGCLAWGCKKQPTLLQARITLHPRTSFWEHKQESFCAIFGLRHSEGAARTGVPRQDHSRRIPQIAVWELHVSREVLSEAAAQTPREEYNDYNFWHVAPPVIIDSEDNEPPGAGACPRQVRRRGC